MQSSIRSVLLIKNKETALSAKRLKLIFTEKGSSIMLRFPQHTHDGRAKDGENWMSLEVSRAVVPVERVAVGRIACSQSMAAAGAAGGHSLCPGAAYRDIGKYVLITRQWNRTAKTIAGTGYRKKVRSVSSDFLNWSKPELAIEGLDLRMQIHDMPVVPYAGVYLGMVGLFDVGASKQWCELAWGPDSIEWHRIQPGKPLIPNGAVMGNYDWGCIVPSKPIVRKDEILIYCGANDGRFMAWRSGYLALARLRPDGFAGYEQILGGSNKTCSVTTKAVSVVDNSLCVSADVAPSGFVKVTLLDKNNKKLAEGNLVTTTVSDAEIEWKDGFSFKKLKGKKIKLKFELRESKLFSFSFNQ